MGVSQKTAVVGPAGIWTHDGKLVLCSVLYDLDSSAVNDRAAYREQTGRSVFNDPSQCDIDVGVVRYFDELMLSLSDGAKLCNCFRSSASAVGVHNTPTSMI